MGRRGVVVLLDHWFFVVLGRFWRRRGGKGREKWAGY